MPLRADRWALLDTEEAKFEVEVIDGKAFIHLLLHKWSHSIFKKYREVFKGMEPLLKQRGFNEVYVAIPDDDAKLLRFERMFGFNVIEHKAGHYLLVREI